MQITQEIGRKFRHMLPYNIENITESVVFLKIEHREDARKQHESSKEGRQNSRKKLM